MGVRTKRNTTTIRNLIAFWIFGLCNNFAYVIMLSAAEDILDKQENSGKTSSANSTDIDETICEATLTGRHCATVSTGAVLLADIIPSLLIKATFPFFMQRIPFGFRHMIVVLIQAGSYLIVAFSTNMAMSLTGVVFASACSGLGEITLLSLTSYFSKNTISTWSSGTGGAGVVGSLAYAALTEPKMGNLSPSTALLIMLVVPVAFAAAYWILLVMPPSVYSPTLSPSSWIVPKHSSPSRSDSIKAVTPVYPIDDEDVAVRKMSYTIEYGTSRTSTVSDTATEKTAESEESNDYGDKVPQRSLTLMEKLHLIPPLLKYMIPLALVYVGEYLINQGIVQLIFFDCDHGFGLTRKSQYRWYQVIYQVGVFISRSSVNIVELPLFVILALPVLQLLNALFFFLDSLFFFVPHIGIVFALILLEGLFGGSSYVNTFNRIHREVAPDVREVSLSIASMSDSFGIVLSGFAAIPLHNYVCGQPLR